MQNFLIPTILAAVLSSFYFFFRQTKKRTSKKLLQIPNHDISALEIKKDTIFFIGVSEKAISVSEKGILRTIEFSKDLMRVFKLACKEPRKGEVYLPDVVVFVNGKEGHEKEVAEMEKMGIRIGELKAQETDVAETPSGVIPFNPQPKRGCFACRKEIEGKASQCSACKAVIYCSAACAKSDWPKHKQICADFKITTDHIQEWKLHDFPFEFYNSEKILHNYNIVPLLSSHNKHNVGLFKRLCGCFQEMKWGEVGRDILKKCQENREPRAMFEILGLGDEMFPLSKPFPKDTDTKSIDSWEKYYKIRKLSMNNVSCFVLEVPLTVAYLINKFVLSSKSEENKENENRKKITVHLVGVEKEADLVPLFECILPLFPKTDLCIHMIGPEISNDIPPEQRAMLIRSASNDSSIFISVNTTHYAPQHVDGSAFVLPGDLPAELREKQNFGTGPPDVVIALNASLVAHPEWASCLQMVSEAGIKFLVTERMEQLCNATRANLPRLGLKLSLDVEPNPFRMPLYEFKKDVNLPGWSNAFIMGIGDFE